MIPAGDDAEQESDADVAARYFAASRLGGGPEGAWGYPRPLAGESSGAQCVRPASTISQTRLSVPAWTRCEPNKG
jgi:hypothetical protein